MVSPDTWISSDDIGLIDINRLRRYKALEYGQPVTQG